MDLNSIISELKSEHERLGRAIAALLPSVAVGTRGRPRKAGRLVRKGGITPEGRRRLSLAMKRRWAKRKMKKVSGKSSAPRKRGGLTAAGRKRLSEMMKKRWAARRAKAS